jgi:N utilization substance protein B
MAKHSLNEIEAQFRVDNDFTDVDGAYFREILHGVPARAKSTSAQAVPGHPLEELDPVELAVLRLSTWELIKRVDVPYRVVINEGIELAKGLRFHRRPQVRQRRARQAGPRLREAEVKANKR